jgi:isocitrate dehydrogenase kinase/phosphatase
MSAHPLPATTPSRRVERAYVHLRGCSGTSERIAATASLILAIFDDFYIELCEYPYLAKAAFESIDPHASIGISRERLGLYSRTVLEHGPRIREAFPALANDERLWDAIDSDFVAMIANLYEADIAFSFAHSLRRNICHGLWRPVAYSFPPPSKRRALSMASVFRRYPVEGSPTPDLIAHVLQAPQFSVAFRDFDGDVQRILRRVELLFREEYALPSMPHALDVVEAGFFRDRTAFVVARWLLADGRFMPLVVAFLNGPEGIHTDALLHRTSEIHNLFSSALANFHVTTRLYYQTCVFLYSLMPLRPLGHQYSTIGYNHIGKVAILEEIAEQVRSSGERFQRSPGVPGTVALGFTFPSCSYHLKVIRDQPSATYKWGTFPGVHAIVDKYRAVHDINRAGSMLDSVMYFNLRLDRDMFDPVLLDEICDKAAGSVHADGDAVFIRSLIVQMKIVPLPVYLEGASENATQTVITNLGKCIRNNAATNIFNKDLDSRNYGVGRYGQVFLFDYDAIERLTEVKIRTNLDREPGEDSVPPWFFEDGVVFLPEELDFGMNFRNAYARRCFKSINADLLTVSYWEGVQKLLQLGGVPELVTYSESCRLDTDFAGGKESMVAISPASTA